MKEQIARQLEEVRQRSLGLLSPVSEEDQIVQHSELMSPLVWDLGHVGNYEEIWLLRMVAGVPASNPELDDIYDAFKHARRQRTRLALLNPNEARQYIGNVRGRVFDILEDVEFDPTNPLLHEGFIYGMVVQHEHQHDETMLATLQLRPGEYPVRLASDPKPVSITTEEVLVDGGTFTVGTDIEPWAYDNERPCHQVTLPPFYIDTAPVTNERYLSFMAEGGYGDRRWWTDEGWAWRMEASLEHPEFWDLDGATWSRTRFGRKETLPMDEPVQHVCWHEADAYARWAGKRLPTEQEWETAASWDPKTKTKRRFPWGNGEPTPDLANLGEARFKPTAVGSFPGGVSPLGCHQMIGDVWEWTSSPFEAYPEFNSFPYREYSEVFFGRGYKVLRGGSWATHPLAIRNTFRNWDFPVRRQIFAGLRCARDA
ncbi:MAG: ergothioneine biosynthesis protein EgtB [Actinomycetota bacterium]